MPKINYLSRCHDSDPDNIRQAEIDAKIQARKEYQKWYQANYSYQTPERLEKQKIYQR